MNKKLSEIESRLNKTSGGDWYTEHSDDGWRLFGRSFLQHDIENLEPADLSIMGIDENGRQEVHPWQLAYCSKKGYYPNEGDDEFLNHVKQDMRYLIERVKELEAAFLET